MEKSSNAKFNEDPSCSMWTDGRTDGRADRRTVRNMTKVTGAFRNFANAFKKPVFDNRTPRHLFYSQITSVDRNILIKDTKERLASPLTDIRKLDIYVHIYTYIFNTPRRAFGSDRIISCLSLFSNWLRFSLLGDTQNFRICNHFHFYFITNPRTPPSSG